jgi:hypothetical protein
MGFKGAKIPLRHGPSEGTEGLKKNVESVRRARESVGDDFPLMIDCYMSLVCNPTHLHSPFLPLPFPPLSPPLLVNLPDHFLSFHFKDCTLHN